MSTEARAVPVVAIVDLNQGEPNRSIAALSHLVERGGGRPLVVEPTAMGHLDLRIAACILSGGPGSPNADHWDGFLRTLESLIGAVPVLGICLGFQLLARHYGHRVVALDSPRLGVYRIHRTASGCTDPLLAELDDDWCFEAREFSVLGSGPNVLARGTDRDATAMRFERDVAGVAFHPEVEPDRLDSHVRAGTAAGMRFPETADQDRAAWAANAVSVTFQTVVPSFVASAVMRPVKVVQ